MNLTVRLVILLTLSGFGIVVWAALAVLAGRRHPRSRSLSSFPPSARRCDSCSPTSPPSMTTTWAAVGPMLARAIGMSVGSLSGRWRGRGSAASASGLGAPGSRRSSARSRRGRVIYGLPGQLEPVVTISDSVRDHRDGDDWAVLRVWGWHSTFYYVRRQGVAIPEPSAEAGPVVGGHDLSAVDRDGILADPQPGPFIQCDHDARCELEERP